MGLQGIQSVSATAYMEDRQVDPQLGQSAYMKSSYMIRGLTDEICQPVAAALFPIAWDGSPVILRFL